MGKKKSVDIQPSLSPEERENYLISLATNEAERRIKDGTASSQLITYYLQLGNQKERLKVEKLKNENELLKAKAESIKSQQHIEELYKDAIKAMQIYSGNGGSEEESYYEDD